MACIIPRPKGRRRTAQSVTHPDNPWFGVGLCSLIVMVLASCSSDPESDNPSEDAAVEEVSQDGGQTDVPVADEGTVDSDLGTETDADIVEEISVTLFDDIRINSTGDENVRSVTTEFEWSGTYELATLVVDLDTTCFPFSEWTTPPAGHNWPADCDAFDRNFEFHILPAEDAEEGTPALELVRAITPFGGPMHFEIDVTDLANGMPGEHVMKSHISTWSDGGGQVTGSAGGWNVTARFDLLPGTPPRTVLAVTPLTDHSYGTDGGTVEIPFEVPEGATGGRIEYRTTGHGGGSDNSGACIGPAEEFCRRWHQIFVDETRWGTLQPWRADCDQLCTLTTEGSIQYCAENPTGAIGSVRAPRANWCPGSLTPPLIVQTDELSQPGQHVFSYFIENVAPGGSWRTSSVFIAYGE